MRHILQKFNTSCVPACLAMIAGISQNKAIKLLHPKHKKGKHYLTYDSTTMRILKKFGYKTKYCNNINKKQPIRSLKRLALIGIEENHLVIWDGQKIYDPSSKKPMNIKWYEKRVDAIIKVWK